MALRYDGSRLNSAKVHRTPQGYVQVPARLSRVGIQTYRRADGSLQRELRHPDDVFAAAALATAGPGVPVTVGHPGLLTPENTAAHRVGGLVALAAPEGGRYLTNTVQVETAPAIARVDSGDLCDISAGYEVDYDPTPGEWEGQKYDGRQTNIRLNHVALLPRGGGRAGTEVGLRLDSSDAVLACEDQDSLNSSMKKIRLDGVEVEVSDEVAKAIESTTSKLAESEKARGALEAKLTDTSKRLDAALEPTALDARVAERVALETAARALLGAEYSAAGKTSRQVHEDALRKVDPAVKFDGVSDERLLGRFEVACASAPGAGEDKSRKDAARAVLDVKRPAGPGAREDAGEDEAEKAYAESVARKGSAWNQKAAK